MADLDDSVEEVDAFSLLMPLPYRLSTVLVLGIWLWGLNLHGLSKVQIDALSLIRYQPARNNDPPPYLRVYRYATVLTTLLVVSMLLFWMITLGGDKSRVVAYEILPNMAFIAIFLLAFLLPQRWLYPKSLWPTHGRSRLLWTLRRIGVGGLAKTEDGKFGDVLLADALTSYARPLSELYIAFSMMVLRRPTTGKIDRSSVIVVPILLAVPFVIRFRQCLKDSQPANALKYATAFPAIALSTYMRAQSPWLGHDNLLVLWVLAASTNALYSFYWDVTMDWDLTMLSSKRKSIDFPYGLRQVRYFDNPQLYYAMIFVDLLLRFAWAFKLSPHLEHYYDIEGGIFLLEVLEVARRFLWIFFRVETEWVRTRHNGDIMLSDLGPKLDED